MQRGKRPPSAGACLRQGTCLALVAIAMSVAMLIVWQGGFFGWSHTSRGSRAASSRPSGSGGGPTGGAPFSSPPMTDAEISAAVRQQYPLQRLQCGNWSTGYAALHRDILAGRAAQRYAVFRSRDAWRNGLADRVASSVTILLYALLTGRAFQVWEGGGGGIGGEPRQGGNGRSGPLHNAYILGPFSCNWEVADPAPCMYIRVPLALLL